MHTVSYLPTIRRMATASKGRSWRITHVARYLGVSRQRAQQLAHADRLPPRVGVDGIGPSWDPDDIRQWAEGWVRERPWRRLGPQLRG